jgi:hypothetical protein
MSFLCGLDEDLQPAAINISNCKSIYLVLIGDPDGEMLYVEWENCEMSRSVYANDAVICTPQRVGAVLMSLKERKT